MASDLSQPLSSSSLMDEPLGAAGSGSAAPATPAPASVAAPAPEAATPAPATTPLSGSSLLERIQAQRAREQQQQPNGQPQPQMQQLPTTTAANGNNHPLSPPPLVIPNYAPMAQNAVRGPTTASSSSSYSSSATSWFQNIFGNGAASLSLQRNRYHQVPGESSSDALLSTNFELADDEEGRMESPLPTHHHQPAMSTSSSSSGPQPYSMAGYFQTFILDMYHLFRSLPTWAQIAIVLLLVYLLWKVW